MGSSTGSPWPHKAQEGVGLGAESAILSIGLGVNMEKITKHHLIMGMPVEEGKELEEINRELPKDRFWRGCWQLSVMPYGDQYILGLAMCIDPAPSYQLQVPTYLEVQDCLKHCLPNAKLRPIQLYAIIPKKGSER